jgi:hypothetical protein
MIDLGVALFSTGDPHQRWLSFGPALTMGKARQIADRFHLLKNLRETIERRPGRFEAPIRESPLQVEDDSGTREQIVIERSDVARRS